MDQEVIATAKEKMGKTRERICVVSKVGSNGDILIATFMFVTWT